VDKNTLPTGEAAPFPACQHASGKSAVLSTGPAGILLLWRSAAALGAQGGKSCAICQSIHCGLHFSFW
jgi:hypothetical protein